MSSEKKIYKLNISGGNDGPGKGLSKIVEIDEKRFRFEGMAIGDVITPELEICDLREQKLSEVWHNSELANLLRDRDKLKGKCGRCEYRFVCGGCRRMAYGVTGDIMGEEPLCTYQPGRKPAPAF